MSEIPQASMDALAWHRAELARLLGDRERLPHALLVQGRDGIGKTAFARALAAGVLCERARKGLACGQCPSCHWFAQGNHPDYREVVPEAAIDEENEGEAEAPRADAKKSLVIKVEQVRGVADFIALTTHRGGWRVLVIRPAEALHPAAANALLKTLEEPPPNTLIVLVTGEPARLLATIRSRCRAVTLGAPAREEALAWLEAQGVAEAGTLLDCAGGAPLLARDLADEAEVAFRRRILEELARPSGANPLHFAANFDRSLVERMIFWMQTWIHDLIRIRMAGDARHHRALAPALAARAKSASLDALFALDRELASARALASHPLNPRLLAEHLLLAYNRATSRKIP